MDWKRLLGYNTGSVNEDLLLRNEFLAEENRILRSKLGPRVRLTACGAKTPLNPKCLTVPSFGDSFLRR